MSNKNKRQTIQLGMPYGTANGRLRKMVLFDLLKKHGENRCYRCSGEIAKCDDLSIEHKKAWLNVDVELFWDLDNIAFSHLKCNSSFGARRKGRYPKHGTTYGYSEKCRWLDCRIQTIW